MPNEKPVKKTLPKKKAVPPKKVIEPKKIVEKKPAEKKGKGRPDKYLPSMCEKAYELATQGLYNDAIAKGLGITNSTMHLYMKDHKDFSDAINIGKSVADEKVERTLYEMAMGFSHTVQKPVVIGTGLGCSEVEIVEYVEKLPPNMTAVIFHLKNRKPKEWRDKQEIGLTDNEGNDRSFTVTFKKPE